MVGGAAGAGTAAADQAGQGRCYSWTTRGSSPRGGRCSPSGRDVRQSQLVCRSGPQTVEQLNAALLGKLAKDKLLRGRKLRINPTVIEADIDHPTDVDLLEHGVRKLARLVRRIKAAGAPSAPGSGIAADRRDVG